MKEKLDKYIPRYCRIPLLIIVLMNFITYNGTKIISSHLKHYDFSILFDDKIPFLPFFASIYILSYLQWIIGFIIIARENRDTCYKFLSAELIAKSICFICFLLIPTTIIRPDITGNNLWEGLTKIIYKLDEPVNLFPSIHCLESWMCFRGALYLKKPFKFYKYITFLFTILVCASTVLIKQHVFVDIIGGILAVEIGIFVANKYKTGVIFEKIESKIKKIS